MASMAAAYGVRSQWRKAMIVLFLVMLTAIPRSQAAPLRLLVLGDSLSAGYGLAQTDGFEAQLAAALHARGHDLRIVDGAVSGDTSAGGLARLDWALDGDVRILIVALGGNDGLRGLPPEELQGNLAQIIERA
jgi:acyl-CoA thioesterase I